MFERATFCFAFCSSIEEFQHGQDEEFCKSESDILQENGDRPRNAHFLMSTLGRFWTLVDRRLRSVSRRQQRSPAQLMPGARRHFILPSAVARLQAGDRDVPA